MLRFRISRMSFLFFKIFVSRPRWPFVQNNLRMILAIYYFMCLLCFNIIIISFHIWTLFARAVVARNKRLATRQTRRWRTMAICAYICHGFVTNHARSAYRALISPITFLHNIIVQRVYVRNKWLFFPTFVRIRHFVRYTNIVVWQFLLYVLTCVIIILSCRYWYILIYYNNLSRNFNVLYYTDDKEKRFKNVK